MFIEKREKQTTYHITPEAYKMLSDFKKKYGISKDLIVSLAIEMSCMEPESLIRYHQKRLLDVLQKPA